MAKSEQTVMVVVKFSEETKHGRYKDALYFTEAEYGALKDVDLKAKKKARVDKWVAEVDNPPVAPPLPEPTPEELEAMIAEKQAELDRLQAELEAKG